MIRRIVKMKFKEEHVATFREIYWSVREAIEAMPGCYSVELLEDIHDPTIMFTYSIWEDEVSLDSYRKSAVFGTTWPKTKALFSEPAEAWSMDFVQDDQ